MSATDNTDHVHTSFETKAWTYGGPALAAAAAIAYASLWIGYTVNGMDTAGLLNDARGLRADWTQASTYAAVSLCAALAVAGALIMRLKSSGRSEHTDMDRAGRLLATDRQLRDLTTEGRAKAAKRKHIDAPALPHLAKTLSGKWIDVGPESTTTMIAGPRSGKTSSLAAPFIVEWDGPVVVTSNKRDLVDKTRTWRVQDGERAWVFDPQSIVREPVSWYWNPVSYVSTGEVETMDIRAARLAHRFAFATGNADPKGSDYFAQTGEGLVASLILAAACDRRTIIEMLDWITDPDDKTPVRVLREHGFSRVADKLAATIKLTPEQRDGIYGTATTLTQFLTFRSVEKWISPGDGRVEFHPHDFVESRDTLYSISREGQGSMGPLVTALTVAVCEAGEDLAQRSTGGRMPVPMALVLDEVANVCRWADLPNVYSHYGSKGIIPVAFLQSWNQGADVWGERGMSALWSASTTRILGPSVAEGPFLSTVVEMIGEYTKASRSRSDSKSGGSSSVQNTRDKVFSVSDLTALPFGRAIVIEAGHKVAYLKLIPYMDRKYGKALKKMEVKP